MKTPNWVRPPRPSDITAQETEATVSIGAIVQAVCASLGSSEKQIREKGRKGNKAKDIAIYLARDLSRLSCKELGHFFGGISGAAITVRYTHVATGIERDRKLNRQLKRIRKQILNN